MRQYHELGGLDGEGVIVGAVLIEFEGPSTALSIATIGVVRTEPNIAILR